MNGTMGFHRREFLALTIGSLVVGLVPAAPALAQRLGKITYGVASIDPTYTMIYLALKKGYFAEGGIEVEYINSQSGPRSKQMLAAKQIFTTTTGMNDAIAVSLAGKPAVVVFGFDDVVTFANILVNKKLYDSGVKSVADLKGRVVAVTQPQAATWLMGVYITERAGLKNQVQLPGLGDFSTMMGAVKSGRVDACMATFAMIDKAKEEGWGVPIFDVTDRASWDKVFGGPVTGVCTYVLKDTLDSKPEQVQALVSGLVKAAAFCRDHTAEQITDVVYTDYLSQYPRPSVVRGIEVFKKVWNYSGIVEKTTYDRLITIMGDGRQYSNAELATRPYEKGCDMSFIRKTGKT